MSKSDFQCVVQPVTRVLRLRVSIRDAGRRRWWFLVAGLVLSVIAPETIRAATYLPLTDHDLAQRAPVIVRGVPLAVETRLEKVDGDQYPFTVAKIHVLEVLKGTAAGTVQVRVPGGVAGGTGWLLPGTPSFDTGGETILFLFPIAGSPGDLFALTEFGLSKFDVLEDEVHRRFAVRSVFNSEDDAFLSHVFSADSESSGRPATMLRDADSFLRVLRQQAVDGIFAEAERAEPVGRLRSGREGIHPLWQNIGGVEGGSQSLFRWFWDTGQSPTAVVAAVGTQTNLTDGSNGIAHIYNAVDQWHGVAGADVRVSGVYYSGDITIYLDAINPTRGYWLDPSDTGTVGCQGGVIGLGGPRSNRGSLTYRGEPGYWAASSGEIWMRRSSCAAGYDGGVFRSAVLHELGHVLGLGHSDQGQSVHSTTNSTDWNTAVMRSVVAPSAPDRPQADDIQAILYYYPTSAPCSYSLARTSDDVGIAGAVRSVTVSAGAGCTWTAVSNISWISVNAGANGAGNGTVTFGVLPNGYGPRRAGTLTIAQQTFTVTQEGVTPPCTYSISPTSDSLPAGGGSKTVSVAAAAGCGWTASSNVSWLSISSASTGSGNGSVSYSAAANSSTASRTGTLTIAQQTFTVTQAPAAPVGCTADSTNLCLNSEYRVSVTWRDFQNNRGTGQAVPLTSDTGYFWFFSGSNVELVVKVLDGRGVNGKYWVFYGALSNVEYILTVQNVRTNTTKTYTNPSGQFASVGDTSAFSGSGQALAGSESLAAAAAPQATPFAAETKENTTSGASVLEASMSAPASCSPSDTVLCLNGGRFRVEANWTDFQGRSGVGRAVSLSGDTGYFWFFTSSNVELVVKALDGRSLNNNYWLFYGALSNVTYTLTVTDTLTFATKTYSNPSGRFASVGDTAAFPSRPESLVGTYAVSSGASTQTGSSCTGASWSPSAPSTDSQSQVVISQDGSGAYFLTMYGVGGNQLPQLRYRLNSVSADEYAGRYVFSGAEAPSGWSIECSGPRTVSATATGTLTFQRGSTGMAVSGTLMFAASIPACSSANCPTTYRDIYNLNHIRPIR